MSLSRGYMVLRFPHTAISAMKDVSGKYVTTEGEALDIWGLSFCVFGGKPPTYHHRPITAHHYKLIGSSVIAKPSINIVTFIQREEEKNNFLRDPIVSVTLLFSFNCRWFLSVPSCEGLRNVPVMKINKPQREPHPVKGNSILSPQFFCHIISL